MKAADAAFLQAVQDTQLRGFAAMLTSRARRRSKAEGLREAGHLVTVQVIVCDGDGWTLCPERERTGYALTVQGAAALAAHNDLAPA